jgi:hypothetical protein
MEKRCCCFICFNISEVGYDFLTHICMHHVRRHIIHTLSEEMDEHSPKTRSARSTEAEIYFNAIKRATQDGAEKKV